MTIYSLGKAIYWPQTGETRQAGTEKHGVWAESPEETSAAAGTTWWNCWRPAADKPELQLQQDVPWRPSGWEHAADTRHTGLAPGLGRPPMPRSSYACVSGACALQLEVPPQWEAQHRSEKSPQSLNLEKARKKHETQSNHKQTNSRRSQQEGRHHTPVGLTTRN